MTKLYSWLHDAVNVEDLNTYLYWRDLNGRVSYADFSNLHTFVLEVSASLAPRDILQSYTVDTEVIDMIYGNKHAIYDPNLKRVVLSKKWLDVYGSYLGYDQAYTLHIAHEAYHVYEENNPVWYAKYPYTLRNRISEVCAIMYSQIVCNLEMHPKIIEYDHNIQSGIYSKQELADYLKEEVMNYEIYRKNEK